MKKTILAMSLLLAMAFIAQAQTALSKLQEGNWYFYQFEVYRRQMYEQANIQQPSQQQQTVNKQQYQGEWSSSSSSDNNRMSQNPYYAGNARGLPNDEFPNPRPGGTPSEQDIDRAIAIYEEALRLGGAVTGGLTPSGPNVIASGGSRRRAEAERANAQVTLNRQFTEGRLSAARNAKTEWQTEKQKLEQTIAARQQADTARQAELARTTPNSPNDFRVLQNTQGTITITDYTGTSPVMIIPETISGIRVTEIGQRAFSGNTRIQKAVIPNTVTNIGGGAFAGCSALAEVVLPNSITHIRSVEWPGLVPPNSSIGAFQDCTALKTITIPNSVTVIDPFAFYRAGLTSIVLPNRLTTIGRHAFHNNQLTSVQFPASLRTIGREAFRNNKITSLALPEGVTFLDYRSFADNPIVSLVIPSSLATFRTDTGNVNGVPVAGFRDAFSTDSSRVLQTLTRITLPSNVDERNMNDWTGRDNVNFEVGLQNFYTSQNKRAGTYIKEGQIWRRE